MVTMEEVRTRYCELMRMGHRTEVDNAEYNYLDKLITYSSLYNGAKAMGNKNPDGNFLISDAKKKLLSAKTEYERVIANG